MYGAIRSTRAGMAAERTVGGNLGKLISEGGSTNFPGLRGTQHFFASPLDDDAAHVRILADKCALFHRISVHHISCYKSSSDIIIRYHRPRPGGRGEAAHRDGLKTLLGQPKNGLQLSAMV